MSETRRTLRSMRMGEARDRLEQGEVRLERAIEKVLYEGGSSYDLAVEVREVGALWSAAWKDAELDDSDYDWAWCERMSATLRLAAALGGDLLDDPELDGTGP